MKRRASRLRVMVVVLATRYMAAPAKSPDAARSRASSTRCTDEWLSEEEMPDRNVDGTPMVNGVDLNGRPYGRCAQWEDDPWHVDVAHACGPGPSDASSDPRGDARAQPSNVFCTVDLVVVEGCTRHARCPTRGARCHTRCHRSMSSRRARRWRRQEAGMRRRITCWWFTLSGEDSRAGASGSAPPEAHR